MVVAAVLLRSRPMSLRSLLVLLGSLLVRFLDMVFPLLFGSGGA